MSEKVCANPLCGRSFSPRRRDAIYCGSTCRGEAVRLRALLGGQGRVAEAVRGALHKREKPRRKGKRPDTEYVVLFSPAPLSWAMGGLVRAHSREEAIRAVSEARPDAERWCAVPLRNFASYSPEGERLGDPYPER